VEAIAPTAPVTAVTPIEAVVAVEALEPSEMVRVPATEASAESTSIDIHVPPSSPTPPKTVVAEESTPSPQAPVVLTEIVANAGLEWVQTRSDFVVADRADETPAPRPPRPVRVRKPKVEIVTEPLQMVETKNDAPL
jgi:hypothetical protein